MRMVPSHVETLPCGNLARLSSKVGGATAAYSNLFWVVQICSSATKSLWGTPSGQLQHATRSSQEWLWAHCWLSFFLLCYQLPLLAKMSTDYVHEGRLINPPSPRGRIADHWSMGSWTLALHLQIPWYSLDIPLMFVVPGPGLHKHSGFELLTLASQGRSPGSPPSPALRGLSLPR